MGHLKGDLPHYAFIFRNPGPLGTELNNEIFSRLGTMFYLDIKNIKEAMKASDFDIRLEGRMLA